VTDPGIANRWEFASAYDPRKSGVTIRRMGFLKITSYGASF